MAFPKSKGPAEAESFSAFIDLRNPSLQNGTYHSLIEDIHHQSGAVCGLKGGSRWLTVDAQFSAASAERFEAVAVTVATSSSFMTVSYAFTFSLECCLERAVGAVRCALAAPSRCPAEKVLPVGCTGTICLASFHPVPTSPHPGSLSSSDCSQVVLEEAD